MKICIGTAQFGLAYGVTNIEGQVQQAQVRSLLLMAQKFNINYLDTAQAYGNSEHILGTSLPKSSKFHIISKLKSQEDKQSFSEKDIHAWERSFQQTCTNLNRNSIDSFLLHSSNDLRKNGSHFLVDWLLGLKQRGLVNRLGISIYDASDLNDVDPRILDLVQLPLSLYDQRLLLNGTIDSLKSRNVAIHARSIYLQGLLLTSASDLPDWIPQDIYKHHEKLINLSIQRRCSLIDLALGFVRDQDSLESVVIGLCNTHQLAQLHQSFDSPSPWLKNEWREWSLNDAKWLDPRFWPS